MPTKLVVCRLQSRREERTCTVTTPGTTGATVYFEDASRRQQPGTSGLLPESQTVMRVPSNLVKVNPLNFSS